MNIQPPTPELEVEPTAITLAASFMSVVANAATCVVAIMFVLGLFEILPIRYCVYPAKVGGNDGPFFNRFAFDAKCSPDSSESGRRYRGLHHAFTRVRSDMGRKCSPVTYVTRHASQA